MGLPLASTKGMDFRGQSAARNSTRRQSKDWEQRKATADSISEWKEVRAQVNANVNRYAPGGGRQETCDGSAQKVVEGWAKETEN
jgi:hypothetical protein